MQFKPSLCRLTRSPYLACLASVRNSSSGSSSNISKMSAGNQQTSGTPAQDMPAAIAFDSPEQRQQEQPLLTDNEQHHDSGHAHGTSGSSQPPAPVPSAHPTGTLQDMDTNDLVAKRNQILWEQAVKGQQPGLTLMQVREHPAVEHACNTR